MKNGVMMQVFEWNLPSDGCFYKNLGNISKELFEIGITSVWMPPASKGTSVYDVGYGIYDFWDLGEFDQKGSVRTKYGTKSELKSCIDELKKNGIEVYADMVFNHKGGADFTEIFNAVEVDSNNRMIEVGPVEEIRGWTGFDFAARDNKYSAFKWHHYHFNGVDYDENTGRKGIFRILGENKYWNMDTDSEYGNFDYLMYSDIDHCHPEVVEEIKKVSDFMIDEMGYDGFRYDALKHISVEFIRGLTKYIKEKHPDFFFVGEYWKGEDGVINSYLDETNYEIDLFDVKLHFNFYEASKNDSYDMRKIFDSTLVSEHPEQAVTFVDNHDTYISSSLSSWVEPWFKEIAYSLILLNKNGYPCVFWGDYEGIYGDNEYRGIKREIKDLLEARINYAWGDQENLFFDEKLIGWIRHGDEEHPQKLILLISTGSEREVLINVGVDKIGKEFVDISGKSCNTIINEEGIGLFKVNSKTVSYWVDK